jgi:hypothetical protein
MRRVMAALAVALLAGLAYAQDKPGGYATGENPFQGEFAFALKQPLDLRVDIVGMRFDSITVTPLGDIKPGEKMRCQVGAIGSNVGQKKASATVVLLLEDADGRALERVSFDPFKVRSGRAFDEQQKLLVSGDALAATARVYVFISIGP